MLSEQVVLLERIFFCCCWEYICIIKYRFVKVSDTYWYQQMQMKKGLECSKSVIQLFLLIMVRLLMKCELRV